MRQNLTLEFPPATADYQPPSGAHLEPVAFLKILFLTKSFIIIIIFITLRENKKIIL